MQAKQADNLFNEAISEYGPNVQVILKERIRIIRGTIFRAVRNELINAVRAGTLGHLKKDGLKPEVFYHPAHKQEAMEHQISEALDAIKCISKVVLDSNGI